MILQYDYYTTFLSSNIGLSIVQSYCYHWTADPQIVVCSYNRSLEKNMIRFLQARERDRESAREREAPRSLVQFSLTVLYKRGNGLVYRIGILFLEMQFIMSITQGIGWMVERWKLHVQSRMTNCSLRITQNQALQVHCRLQTDRLKTNELKTQGKDCDLCSQTRWHCQCNPTWVSLTSRRGDGLSYQPCLGPPHSFITVQRTSLI